MEQAPIAYEPILLVGSVLMLAGIMAGKVGTRFGVPALLLFLITGMIFGSAGLGIQYMMQDTRSSSGWSPLR